MKQQLIAAAAALLAAAPFATSQIKTVQGQDGWDIYQAGNYRYGPSFITNDDGSIDAWFAAPGQEYEDCVLYNWDSACTPYRVSAWSFIAQYFEVDRPFVGISIYSPTWGDSDQSVRMSIHQWQDGVNKTRLSTPLARTTCSGFGDNAMISVTTDNMEPLPPGKYALVLDQASANAGVYVYAANNPDFNGTAYLRMTAKTGQALRAFVLYDSKKIVQYWDQASYQRSFDGGRTWTPEKMVLKPTRKTRDEYSICDPGVAFWGGYYYCGYTSTENRNGIENHLYMARSTSPEGPWEKWNGSGWGGDNVAPVVEYPLTGGWGIGEPSIVVKDNTVYLYYTYDSAVPTTRVALAPADDENWPAKLDQKGVAINKVAGSDHCDVKYVDAARRFLAVNTARRMTKDAYIQMWQSDDGIHFEPIGDGRMPGIIFPSGLHNCGLNGDARGHIDVSKPQHIAFAYGLDANGNSAWAAWSTFLQPITIDCDAQSGIKSVTIDNTAAPVHLFNLHGVEVDPQTAAPGLYIRRQGSAAEKNVIN